MGDAFASGGIMMWPLLLIGIGVLALSARTAYGLYDGTTEREITTLRLRGILFWGAMAVLLGFLGTVIGLIVMAQAAAMAGAVAPPLIWGGVGVSLVTLIFGLVIFLVAVTAWYFLWQAHDRRSRPLRRAAA